MRRHTKIGDKWREVGSETLSLPPSDRLLLGDPYVSVIDQVSIPELDVAFPG